MLTISKANKFFLAIFDVEMHKIARCGLVESPLDQ